MSALAPVSPRRRRTDRLARGLLAVGTLLALVPLVLVLYYVAVGIWGLFLGIRGSGPSPGFRGAIAVAVIASLAQGGLGLLVNQPPDGQKLLDVAIPAARAPPWQRVQVFVHWAESFRQGEWSLGCSFARRCCC